MKRKIISITGTPTTGKSTLAKILAKKIKYKRLDLSHHYKQISKGYNQTKQCYDIDLKKLTKLIEEKSKEDNLLIDSHLSHLLPKKMINLCLVLTCSNLKKLEQRLKKRNYSKKKVRENLDSEIFQICLNEAKENRHKILLIDTNKKINQKELIKKINKLITK